MAYIQTQTIFFGPLTQGSQQPDHEHRNVWGGTQGRNWGLSPTSSTNFSALWIRHLEITILHLLKSSQDDNWLQTHERLWARNTHISDILILTHRICEDNNYYVTVLSGFLMQQLTTNATISLWYILFSREMY